MKLSSAKRELIGDGQDETTIEIQAVSANGKRLRDFKGKVKVTTTRGKLSARGGIVDLVRGNARITLTSVNETVERVTITAHALEGVCGAGTLSLEFV